MTFDLDQAHQTFIVEARELLQDMETALLRLENESDDGDILGAIFRAAHTIKGSAGLFGLTSIVGFTHIVEDVLDRLRDGAFPVEGSLVALLLASADHMLELVEVVANQGNMLDAAAKAREADLTQRLLRYRASSVVTTAAPLNSHTEAITTAGGVASELWHISLRFGRDVYRNGMDPLSFLRYLNTLGRIEHIITLADAMPDLDNVDPESCYLGFEIDFASEASRASIVEVFDFVRDDCEIHVLAPHSQIYEYQQLIEALPEGPERLGDILTRCGALTPLELQSALDVQRDGVAKSESMARPLGEILIEQHFVEPVVVQSALDKQTGSRAKKHNESHFVRVEADKLDELINLVGELVIAAAGTQLLARGAANAPLMESAASVSDLVEEILDGALQLRMVPIGESFNRFRRVVRDVSQELGKDIDLLISGAETELDKTVVEKIGDPLMHLLRNAMDHGIEAPAVRVAAGKPAKGTLRLNAFHDSGSIVLDIIDDGTGLNRERILQKAVERGLISPTANPSDAEVYNLIFEAGFSTAEVVTNLSGRGVGMDVVKRNITLLRGSIDINSQPGHGTHIRIRLPLTLAIIHGFQVGVGPSSYVIALDMVQECLELGDGDRHHARNRGHLDLRDEVLPLVWLRDYFSHGGNTAGRENVVVVRYGEQKAGLVVDALYGELQTVIKPLGPLFNGLHGISGSTILGSGVVALILDIPALFAQLGTHAKFTLPAASDLSNRQGGNRNSHGETTQ